MKPKNYLRNIGVLSSGMAMGQACIALAMPLISRIYTPAEFGALGIYMSTLNLLAVVAMFRYEVAIPLGQSDEEAINLLVLGLACAIGWALVCFVLLAALYWALPPASPWRKFVFLLPLGVVSTGLYQALSSWAVRQQDYHTLAKTRMTQSLGMVLSQVGFGLLKLGGCGLLLGHIIGQSGGIGSLSQDLRKTNWHILNAISLNRILGVAKKYRRFPIFSSWAALLNASLDAIPLLFLASRFPHEVTGWYTLGLKILVVPGALLTTSLSQVHFSEFARLAEQGTHVLKAHFQRRSLFLWVVTLLFATPLVFIAAWLIPVFFGQNWKNTVTVVQIMGPAFLINLATSSFGCVLDVLRRQDLHLIREVVRVGTLGATAAVCWAMNLAWVPALCAFSAVSALSSIWAYTLSCHAIIVDEHRSTGA